MIFVLYHLVVWYGFSSKILDSRLGAVGDLGRISYQVGSIHNREISNDLKKSHIRYGEIDGQKIDIITIGDSFSNGVAGGKNPYYQDYIASIYDLNVLNIHNPKQDYSFIETINALIENGWIEEISPKLIIIETVGRKLPELYSRDQDWSLRLDSSFEKFLDNQLFVDDILVPKLINTANYKLPFYSLLYKFKTNARSSVYRFKLSKELFSTANTDMLLVYREDIDVLQTINQDIVDKINSNFNKLSENLNKLDIALVFMPAVDKFDLYFPYVENNTYQDNKLFSLLNSADKKYYFLDTKSILSSALSSEEKDIFYADDTHWSYKASEYIISSDSFKNIIDELR